MLFASCSFCYTGGHFRSTRANADVICAHDHYTVSFRGRRKKARDERRRDDKEGRGIGQRLSMSERASCRDEKDELKCERARAQRRMMIDRLFRGLEFDFSFRRRENTYGTVLRFCISLFFFFRLFFLFFRVLYFSSLEKSTQVFRLRYNVRYSRIVTSGDFPDARSIVKGCHREENARRSFFIERIISALNDTAISRWDTQ